MVDIRRIALATAAMGAVAVEVAVRRARSQPDPHAGEDFFELADLRVQHREVDARDGARLHILSGGEGRPLVLVHGVWLQAGIWRYQFDLTGSHRVIAIDQRGHGRSTVGTAGYGLDCLADDLADVLETLDLRDAILVGHSMGGMATIRLAHRHPSLFAERVAGLALLGTSADSLLGFGSVPLLAPLAQTLAVRAQRWRWERLPRYPLADNDISFAIVRLSFGRSPSPHHVDVTRRMVASMSRQALHRSFAGLLDNNARALLRAIDVPTVIVVGSRDTLTLPRTARRLTGAIPGAELRVLAGAGHQLMLERPAELNAMLEALSARVTA